MCLFDRGEEKESKIKTAESHLKLGEVSLETGKHHVAFKYSKTENCIVANISETSKFLKLIWI